MPTRNELKRIATTRLKEAKALYDKGLYDGSVYLAGYVAEIALKARICKILKEPLYPDTGRIGGLYKTHNMDDLVTLAGLRVQLDQKLSIEPQFRSNWTLVTRWNEALRYRPIGSATQSEATRLINALEDTNEGVFTWIKKRW